MPEKPSWNEPDALNREFAKREPVPVPPPSPGASDVPRHTPECGCMVEIRANGITVKGPAIVAVLLCPLHEAAPDLYAACSFVKSFLLKLEGGETFDPLRDLRRRFHAPVHAILDAAMIKARGSITQFQPTEPEPGTGSKEKD